MGDERRRERTLGMGGSGGGVDRRYGRARRLRPRLRSGPPNAGARPWPPVRDRAGRRLRRGPLLPNVASRRDFDRGDRSDEELLRQARRRDPKGDYRIGRAEALGFPDRSFDLVVSYLTLIDTGDIDRAVAEMARVLRPRGTLLIANLTSFATAGADGGWQPDSDGRLHFCIDHYLDERAEWVSWRGIRVKNWHRPRCRYMPLLLGAGLTLTHFDEPAPNSGDPDTADRYRRVPWFLLMEWEKTAGRQPRG